MPTTDYPQVTRLYTSLLNHTDEQTAKNIVSNIPLSKTPTDKKRFVWAKDICKKLDEQFEETTIVKIRMDCACGPSKGHMDKLKKLYDSTKDLDDFARRFNEADLGSTIWIEDTAIFLCYPTCYCSCVNKVDKPLSKTWCYCTLGYAKNMFTYVLCCEVTVELIESVKQGDNRCVIKVERAK